VCRATGPDRLLPEPKSAADDLRVFVGRLGLGAPARAALGAAIVLVLGAGIVLAGTPARGFVVANSAEILSRLPAQVDPGTLPAVTIGQDVADFDPSLASGGMNDVVVTLAQNLELENVALLHDDPDVLTAVDHGDRLAQMQQRLQAAPAAGLVTADHYQFATLHATLLIPFGKQDGFSIGLEATGTLTQVTYDANHVRQGEVSKPFALTFAVRRATGDRWLTVGVLDKPPS
jgi:hypothetical protein